MYNDVDILDKIKDMTFHFNGVQNPQPQIPHTTSTKTLKSIATICFEEMCISFIDDLLGTHNKPVTIIQPVKNTQPITATQPVTKKLEPPETYVLDLDQEYNATIEMHGKKILIKKIFENLNLDEISMPIDYLDKYNNFIYDKWYNNPKIFHGFKNNCLFKLHPRDRKSVV